MPSITVGAAASNFTLFYTGTDALAYAQAVANTITAGENGGTLTAVTNTATGANGSVASQPPSGASGVVAFSVPTTGAVLVPGGDQYIIDAAMGPVSLQGGAAGGALVAGQGLVGAARNLTYTNITPTGTATDYIAILGGNNLVQTSVSGGGNYTVFAGDGNDTINILTGNGTVNAGSGFNQINLGSGNSLIASEGYDTITGSSVGGGTDTVAIGSGQTSINSGTSSFLVNDSSPNPLTVTLGSGVDTINLLSGSPVTIVGVDSTLKHIGAGTITAAQVSTGDSYTVTGSGSATVTAAAGNETVNGTGSTGSNYYAAGTGNDTLIAGAGADTLQGAKGFNAAASLVSGTGATTFQFTNGAGGASDTISGFKSTDLLSFSGYGSSPQATAVTSGGSTIYTLTDGTTLTINGTAPTTTQIKTS